MNSTTKTILIVSSVIAIGGIGFLLMKKRSKNKFVADEGQGGNETPQQSSPSPFLGKNLKGVDLTMGGTRLPTKEEFTQWKKDNPFSLNLPSLSDYLKSAFKKSSVLNLGEQVPSKSSVTTYTTNSNFGIDQNKLAMYKKQYGL